MRSSTYNDHFEQRSSSSSSCTFRIKATYINAKLRIRIRECVHFKKCIITIHFSFILLESLELSRARPLQRILNIILDSVEMYFILQVLFILKFFTASYQKTASNKISFYASFVVELYRSIFHGRLHRKKVTCLATAKLIPFGNNDTVYTQKKFRRIKSPEKALQLKNSFISVLYPLINSFFSKKTGRVCDTLQTDKPQGSFSLDKPFFIDLEGQP